MSVTYVYIVAIGACPYSKNTLFFENERFLRTKRRRRLVKNGRRGDTGSGGQPAADAAGRRYNKRILLECKRRVWFCHRLVYAGYLRAFNAPFRS